MTTSAAPLTITNLLPGQIVRLATFHKDGEPRSVYAGTVVSIEDAVTVELRDVDVYEDDLREVGIYGQALASGWYHLDEVCVGFTGQAPSVELQDGLAVAA